MHVVERHQELCWRLIVSSYLFIKYTLKYMVSVMKWLAGIEQQCTFISEFNYVFEWLRTSLELFVLLKHNDIKNHIDYFLHHYCMIGLCPSSCITRHHVITILPFKPLEKYKADCSNFWVGPTMQKRPRFYTYWEKKLNARLWCSWSPLLRCYIYGPLGRRQTLV